MRTFNDNKITKKKMVVESSRCSHQRVSPNFAFVWAKLLFTRISILTIAPSSLMISYQVWTSNRSEISVLPSSGGCLCLFLRRFNLTPGFVQEEDNSRRKPSCGDSDQEISGGIPGYQDWGTHHHQHVQDLSLPLTKLFSCSLPTVLSATRQSCPRKCDD